MTNTELAKPAAVAAEKGSSNQGGSHKEASKSDEAKEKDIASKVEHDVKVMSLGSKHPDHNPAKGLIVQTPSKEVIEDAREQAQRKHETKSDGPPDWRDLPNTDGKTHWQILAEKEQKKK